MIIGIARETIERINPVDCPLINPRMPKAVPNNPKKTETIRKLSLNTDPIMQRRPNTPKIKLACSMN